MRPVALAALLALAGIGRSDVLIAQSPPLVPFRGLIDHVSATYWGGVPYISTDLAPHAISGDGRFVVMWSPDENLVPGDTNWITDVFLRDRAEGTTTRLSVTPDGGEADQLSYWATISTDGRHVAFASWATNLVPGDTNGQADVFVRDLDQQRTVRVSVSTDGIEANYGAGSPAISASGRFVVFASGSTNLVPGLTESSVQAYVHDRDADVNGVFDEAGGVSTSLVGVSLTGGLADAFVDNFRISSDGRFILFESPATNLSEVGNPNWVLHLYLHDRQLGQTTLVDRAVTGGPSAEGIGMWTSDMTDDGRYVTFSSYSNDIVFLDWNWYSQVFRYDTIAGPAATTVVSALADGTLGDNWSYASSISADGRYVAFPTYASNLASPGPAPGSGSLVVRDMVDGTFTRADLIGSGDPFDHNLPSSPSLSADGTALAFESSAVNAVDGQQTGFAQHAFVVTALSAAPMAATLPMAGGEGSIDVNTAASAGWVAVSLDPWIVVIDGAGYAAGPRTVTYGVASNDAGIVREGQIRVGSLLVTIHQEGDGDTTPPEITPTVTGTLGPDGWYISDVSVTWSVSDPDSEIVSIVGCQPVTFTTDFLYASPMCEATSHGGLRTVSVPLKRDTTGPVINLTTPKHTIYARGSFLMPFYECNDVHAGVATCTSPASLPLNTNNAGWHLFTVTATDRAGNTSTKSVEYLVGTGSCVALPTVSSRLRGWWMLDSNYDDSVSGYQGANTLGLHRFLNAVVRQGWDNYAAQNYVAARSASDMLAVDSAISIAAWVNPRGQTGEAGTIVENPQQYRVARFPDGTLRWAFNQTTGFTWVNTGVQLPLSTWSHVAVTYENGAVNSYLNGRPVHTAQVTGTLTSSGPNFAMSIGGRSSGTHASLTGIIDDVMVLDGALPAADLDTLVRSGSGSLCTPFATNIELTVPDTVAYGTQFPVTARLTVAGQPLRDRLVTIGWMIAPGMVWGRTDANGFFSGQLSVPPQLTVGEYPDAIRALFLGAGVYPDASALKDVTLVGGDVAVTWPPPAPIAYGTPLGAAQLNATASLPGTWAYSPPAGTVLDAGTQTLTTTFTPTDLSHWAPKTVSTTIVVNRAVPSVAISSAPVFYTGQPRSATAVVTGLGGVELNPVTILYDGSSAPPVNAGTYALEVRFDGNTNYEPVTANGSFVIQKATPIISTLPDVNWTYDGTPWGISVNIAGVNGEWLTPVVTTYNGSPENPVNAGVYTVEVRFDGSANYNAISRSFTLTILKATPSLTWPNPAGIVYGTALGAAQLNASSNVPGTFSYSPEAGTVLNAGTHTLTASFTPADTANYEGGSVSRTLEISKANTHPTWFRPADIVYGTPLGAAQLNATVPVPGTFSYSPPADTILGAGEHILSVTFTPDDTANYNGSSASVPFTVIKAAPSLSWSAPADIVYGTAIGGAQLNATANVPGTFVYSPTAGAVLAAGAQTLSVTFTPDDAANYNTATASVTLNVTKAASVITWPAPADIVYGAALGAAQLNATANVAGTFSYSPAAGAVLAAGSQTLSVTFTPTDAANYNGATASVTLNVTKAASIVTWPAPADIVYGTALGAAQLNATANVAGTFSYAPAAGAMLAAGTHTLSVTFTPDDAANYDGGTASVTLNVTKAAAVITWPAPADIVYGTALGAAQLNATANVAGTFSYSPTAGFVLAAGAHTLSVTFTPSDAANYNGAATTRALTVAPAPLTITAGNASKVFGAPLPAFSAVAAGFVNGDSMASLSGALGFTTSATASSPVGSYPVTPHGVSSPNYAIAFANGTLTVVPASTATVVAASPNPSGRNQPATLVATVSAVAPGAGVPTGIVQFFDGGTLLGSAALAGGSASLTTNGFTTGNHTISTSYAGDGGFNASAGSGSLTVLSTSASSTTVVTSSANQSTFGQNVTLTATVSSPSGLSGSVAFYDGSVLLATIPLSGTTARLTTSTLGLGGHAITARYLGNATIPPSVSPAFPQYVRPSGASTRTSTTALTASPSPATLGSNVTLTATVTGSQNQAPAGVVLFMANGSVVGQSTLSPIGSVTARTTFSTSALPHGTHKVEAVYLGNGTYRASVKLITLVVN